MAQTTARKKKKRKKSRRKLTKTGVLLISLLLALAAVLLLLVREFRNQSSQTAQEAEPYVSVSTVPSLPGSGLIAECFGESEGYKTYVSDTITAKLGADLSSHQGAIDWEALSQSPVDFVILRAGSRGYSDGSIHIDESFADNLAAAQSAGLGVGVYFFSQALSAEEAQAEAHTVLGLLGDAQIDYPIYYDWEPITDDSARTATISSSEITACAKSFCEVIQNAGYKAGVYFNLAMAQAYYHLTDLQDYEFWLAEYRDTPSYPYTFGMWQYTNEGTIPGVSTAVDLNLCFRSYGS